MNGHILDRVISRHYDHLIKGVSVSSMLSDHFLININVSLPKKSVSAKVISYRKYKSINKEAFLFSGIGSTRCGSSGESL